jgi:two-component system NarL family response regulator
LKESSKKGGSNTIKTRIIVVEDHPMFRAALCQLIHSQPDMVVVAQTGMASDVLALVHLHAPHLVCMDIGLQSMSGTDLTRLLTTALPHIKVLALSTHSDQLHVLDMLAAGARGYVTKGEDSEEFFRAIRSVMLGNTYLCPDVANMLALNLVHKQGVSKPQTMLSARERQVLKLVTHGQTSNLIAQQLQIAEATVDVHRRNIMRKLNLHSVAELTRYVVSNEWSCTT